MTTHSKLEDPRLSLSNVRRSVSKDDIANISASYVEWVEQPLYMILKKHGEYESDSEVVAVRARKRGDEQYARRTIFRCKELQKNTSRLGVRSGRQNTQAIFLTLTYRNNSSKKWESIGPDFNLFLSRVRRRFGRVLVFRIWESHKSGFPHVHAILLFEQHIFRCFTFRGKIRIKNKDEISGLWPHGFIDCEGIYNLKGAIGYLIKYLSKTLRFELPGALATMAMCWYHRKRMFSISHDLIQPMHNSNTGTWSFVGICTCSIDLTRVWILFACKTDKGVEIVWQKQRQMKLLPVFAVQSVDAI